MGLHLLARARPTSQAGPLTLAVVQQYLPKAASIAESGDPPVWEVRNADGQSIALACLTSPQADQIVGYAGPNNVLLIMNTEGQVTQTHWLQWLDTRDHVERVRAADNFWQQFQGRSLGQSDSSGAAQVDGVSGATLTSLAIAEAIELRLSGKRPSLRFPQAVTLEDVQSVYPDAYSFTEDPQRTAFVQALDFSGATLGWLLRTGPLVDDKIGYQGPTELWLAIDNDDRVTKIKLRSSYDNEPYVRYTRMEASFWSKFVGRTLTELSEIDLAAEGIEGVSGATMTSMAAADTVRAVAQRLLQQAESTSQPKSRQRWNWSLGELATGLLACLLVPWSLSKLRGRRRWRLAWQLLAFVVIVGLSGNLLSMALLAGWTRSGPAITFAPGLALLVVVSLAMPAFMGRNVYCDHVCPHGMLQQWLVRWQGKKRFDSAPLVQLQLKPADQPRKPSRQSLHRALKLSGVIILVLCVSWVVWTVPSQLTFFEPFDVYAWRVGWSVSLGVWLGSLWLAAWEPMGYCRLACPTGMLLEGIRRKRAGRRWPSGDMLLIALTGFVWLLLWWTVK